MAEPRSWTILQAVQTRLATIRIAAGYRTEIGARVALEPAQYPAGDAVALTLHSTGLKAGQSDTAARPVRELDFTAEASVPVTLADAHHQAHQIVADVQDALRSPLTLAGLQALPLRWGDVAFLDRPEGLPVIAVQINLTAEYLA